MSARALPLLMLALSALPAHAQETGDAARGLAYAKAHCAECHAVEGKTGASPRAASFRDIANTPGMTGIALAAFLGTPHKNMPDLILKPEDRNDVIAYILGLRDRPPTP
jgi:mono/diheme cytochrome c family protein